MLRAIELVREPARAPTHEPWVVAFGVNVTQTIDDGNLPADAPTDYAPLCDWLLARLLHQLRSRYAVPLVAVDDLRDGECFSVRIAFLRLDVDRLAVAEVPPWEVLEIARYSELYDGGWEKLFSEMPDKMPIWREGDLCPTCEDGELSWSRWGSGLFGLFTPWFRCSKCGGEFQGFETPGD